MLALLLYFAGTDRYEAKAHLTPARDNSKSFLAPAKAADAAVAAVAAAAAAAKIVKTTNKNFILAQAKVI